eukprot:TRINITY_DN1020_c0_g1_i4.p1 TRINITY_DN1020_c0_g1~~TRINITY_DN1020_c0_g1_i4.p1  ORF type:complete len:525 (-),score=122.02 TRINITY_DN1020_c0_g1_i4:378-1952(-)
MEKLKLASEEEYEGKKLKLIAIFSKNRLEWVLTDIACWLTTTTNIPLYETLGEGGFCHIAEQTRYSTIFVSAEGLNRVIDLKKRGKLPALHNVVCFDDIPVDLYGKNELNLAHYMDVIELGQKETEVPLRNCKGEDIMTICYTSGTSGTPKGAIILYGNFRNKASAFSQVVIKEVIKSQDTLISYLPLAHVFERIMVHSIIMNGLREAFYHGVVSELRDDIMECQPALLVGVPRILCRFHDSIMKTINNYTGFKKSLALAAIKAKLAHYRSTGQVTHWLYDKLVFNEIRKSFGGRIKTIVSASAPLDSTITENLKIFLSAYYNQGFGQTETHAPISTSHIDDLDPASCGPPLPRGIVKLVDVPEMNYFSTDVINGVPTPRGELCTKGLIIPGYFKDPKRTAELIDSEGWLHTGDVVLITPNGCIKVIDRKKNLFKLQQGEYVAPEKIENILYSSPWVLQVVVYGDSYRNYIVGLVIPREEAVMNWAKKNNVKGSFEEVCAEQKLNKIILKALTDLSREKKVRIL